MARVFGLFRDYPDLVVLYNEPAVVFGLFRQLSALAQHFVITYLFLEHVDEDYFELLVHDRSLVAPALAEVCNLRVYNKGEGKKYRLNPDFATQLKEVLLGKPHCSLRIKRKPDKRRPTPQFLEDYSKTRWHSILNYLAGLGEAPSDRLIFVLKSLRLLQDGGGQTSDCFRFLLQTRKVQASAIVGEYARHRSDRAAVLKLLFNLSTAAFGVSYTSGADQSLMSDLCDLGLIYKSKAKSKRFYVTTHMRGLLTESSGPQVAEDQFLIVETNFRVYAYTSSDVHVVLLYQFLQLEIRLPDLAICLLTRESIQRAFDKGISATEVISFLTKHARNPIASNVADQISLWEDERKRVIQEQAVMLEDFIDMSVYRSTLKYVTDQGGCLWEDEVRRVIVVKNDKAQLAIDFIHKQERL